MTFAGPTSTTTTAGFADGTGSNAKLDRPIGIAADSTGSFVFCDMGNSVIRKMSSVGEVTTFAGTIGIGSYVNGVGTNACFNQPTSIAVGPSGLMYVGDSLSYRIRTITTAGLVSALAGSGTSGLADGVSSAASFRNLQSLYVDSSEVIYVADQTNNIIRKVTSSGSVSFYAGKTSTTSVIDGTVTQAVFGGPIGITMDSSGAMYVVEWTTHCIRKISSAGMVTTIAGTGTVGTADGTGTVAGFNGPRDIKVDTAGNLYVAEQTGNRIRLITPGGVVTTLAGSAAVGTADGVGTSASFNSPSMLSLDSFGNLYVTEKGNNRIRAIYLRGTHFLHILHYLLLLLLFLSLLLLSRTCYFNLNGNDLGPGYCTTGQYFAFGTCISIPAGVIMASYIFKIYN